MEEQTLRIKNKKAFFNYEITDKYVAGIQLFGTEVKSIRESKLSFTDAYCIFIKDELWLRDIHISEYKFGSYNNHIPKRDRKLLLNKKELTKIKKKVKEKSLSIIPLVIFFSKSGFVKLEIGIGKGKKQFDKRETLKSSDSKRELDRVMKDSY